MALKFGTSGVRGPVVEMTDRECALFTRAFLDYLQEHSQAHRVYVGGDLRASTPRIMRAVAYAIHRSGLKVVDAGHVPTPALMYAAMVEGSPSIMVTGSHIPDDRNGIKFNLPWGEVLKDDEPHISARYHKLKEDREPDQAFDSKDALIDRYAPTLGSPLSRIVDQYKHRYLQWFPDHALQGQTIVLYEHSAVGRDLLGDLLESLGAQVKRVGRTDHFVPVDTEAVDQPERLAAWVRKHQADALVTADGDTDRPLVVDETGNVIRGDVLGIIVAAALGAQAVVAPVSCNTALESCGAFTTTRRTQIGSPYVIATMKEVLAEGLAPVVGYEANGGFLLGSPIPGAKEGDTLLPLPTRDAVLPILTILAHAAKTGNTLSELVAALPERYTISGLLREVPNATGKAFVADLETNGPAIAERLLQAQLGSNVKSWDYTDGARMTLADGRILHLRPSGNAPEFRIYTEADSEEAAQALNDTAASIVRATIETYDNEASEGRQA